MKIMELRDKLKETKESLKAVQEREKMLLEDGRARLIEQA